MEIEGILYTSEPPQDGDLSPRKSAVEIHNYY